MNVAAVFLADLVFHLPDGFHKGKRLNVADRSAYFRYDYVGACFVGGKQHAAQNFFGDVGDYLDGSAVKASLALFVEDAKVNAACGGVGALAKSRVGEALVVAQVQVGFRSVVGDENLAVLDRIHRARVDVQVGVEFLVYNLVAAAL